MNFSMCIPAGGGDRSGNFQPIGSVTLDEVPARNVPVDGVIEWDIPPDFPGHSGLAVEIADYKIPKDSNGVALASDDVWLANNSAQKNVFSFVPLSSSPYQPVEFDYSVHNDAVAPELAYLEPDGLPYGMTLTVMPRSIVIPPKTTVTFHCTLELDDTIVDAGCRSDRQFRIGVWRQEKQSASRWGGVQYKVMPRIRCTMTLSGNWSPSDIVSLQGRITPDPGASAVLVRISFDGVDPFWATVAPAPGGTFSWSGPPQGMKGAMNAVA